MVNGGRDSAETERGDWKTLILDMNSLQALKLLKCILKSLLILSLSTVIGTILLVLVGLIPRRAIYENTKASVYTLYNEGFEYSVMGIRGDMLDVYTDGLMLNIAYYTAGDIKSTVLATMLGDGMDEPLTPIREYLEGKDVEDTRNYSRYWHGYLIFLKPLLCFGSIISIRVLNLVLQFASIFTVLYLLFTRNNGKNRYLSVPFVTLWLCMSPVALFSSPQYYSVFYSMIISVILLLTVKERSFEKLWNIFLITGILIGYLDLLTYPVLSLGVPMILYLSLDYDVKKSAWKRIAEIVAYSASWCLGYGGMFVFRWGISSAFGGYNFFHDGMKAVLYRTSREHAGIEYSYWDTLKLNFSDLSNQLVIISVLAAIVVYVISIKRIRRKVNLQTIIALLFVCTYPFIWFFVLTQHSHMHHWMTYRGLIITLYGLLSIVYVHLVPLKQIIKS